MSTSPWQSCHCSGFFLFFPFVCFQISVLRSATKKKINKNKKSEIFPERSVGLRKPFVPTQFNLCGSSGSGCVSQNRRLKKNDCETLTDSQHKVSFFFFFGHFNYKNFHQMNEQMYSVAGWGSFCIRYCIGLFAPRFLVLLRCCERLPSSRLLGFGTLSLIFLLTPPQTLHSAACSSFLHSFHQHPLIQLRLRLMSK